MEGFDFTSSGSSGGRDSGSITSTDRPPASSPFWEGSGVCKATLEVMEGEERTRVASQQSGGRTGLGCGFFPLRSLLVYRRGLVWEARVWIYCMVATGGEDLYGEQNMPKRAWSAYSMYGVCFGAWPAAWERTREDEAGRPGQGLVEGAEEDWTAGCGHQGDKRISKREETDREGLEKRRNRWDWRSACIA
jgi:hypothetical protein